MLIGLCGAAGAGKNTVAEALCLKYGWIQFGFADPVYAAVSAATGIPVQRLRDRSMKEQPIEWLGKSPRELLQTLGTEWGRNLVRSDIWVQVAMRQVDACRQHACSVVLTDVRFENEADAIKSAGGLVWRVVRGSSSLSAQAAKHSSEAGIPDYLVDSVIENRGTIHDLSLAVDAAIKRLQGDTIEG